MVHEMRVIIELVHFSVLQHKQTLIFQDAAFEDAAGNAFYFRQGIGRISKDEVKLFPALFDEPKRVRTEGGAAVCLYFVHYLPDER